MGTGPCVNSLFKDSFSSSCFESFSKRDKSEVMLKVDEEEELEDEDDEDDEAARFLNSYRFYSTMLI